MRNIGRECYDVNALSSPKQHVESLMPSVVLSGDRTFRVMIGWALPLIPSMEGSLLKFN